MEDLSVADTLSGRYGSNRSSGHRQIAAETDREALLAWLNRYSDNSNTFASNRKEATRLLLWSLVEAGKPLSSLTCDDLLLYQHFLTNPQPVERWIMTRKWPRHSLFWRPFLAPLAATSIRQALVVLSSMFTWLVRVGYLAGNPLSFQRQRRIPQAARIVRFLDEESWMQVKVTIQSMPVSTPRERAAQARVRWVFSLLFLCALRISEIVKNTMGKFFCRVDKEGQQRWWLEVTGKGNKSRLVPATTELMTEAAHYRRSIGLPPVPLEYEATPLVLPLGWQAPQHSQEAVKIPSALTRATAHVIVKSVFEQTAQRLETQGESYWVQAQRFRTASAHWLRHTAGSRLADTVDLRHVRDTLGHASLNTTSLYLHVEEDQRHRAIEAGHSLEWDKVHV